ncbi:MAG: serine hydrolase [Planctomycetota bacterium]|jgi:hypothetical protein
MAVVLALLLLLAPASVEERFIAALKSDLTTGTTERTAPFIAPVIRDKLPPSRLLPVYKQWQQHGRVLSIELDPRTPFIPNRKVRFLLKQERAESHVVCIFDVNDRIISYFFRPAPSLRSRAELDEITAKWSGDWCWCVATADGTTSAGKGAKEFPLGSIFKLYVLAEVAAQMEEGTISAKQPVKLREQLKSLPSGVLHTREAGTEVSVDEMAKLMISISDNTATDHLLHLVGRERIEAGLKRWRNSCPERNIPFLTTREMFLIKGGGKEAEIPLSFAQLCGKWEGADRATRMGWVTTMTAPFADKKLAELIRPIAAGYSIRSAANREHLTFEWFARPRDVCALLLDAQAGKLPGARHFLKYYGTGGEIYPREWVKYYGFKGGSEMNVMAMSAMAVDGKGKAVAVCVCRQGDIGTAAAAEVQKLASSLLHTWLNG